MGVVNLNLNRDLVQSTNPVRGSGQLMSRSRDLRNRSACLTLAKRCWRAGHRTGFHREGRDRRWIAQPGRCQAQANGVWRQCGVSAPGWSYQFAKPFGGSCSEPVAPLKAAQQPAGQALYWNVRWWEAARQLVPRRGTQESCRRRTRRLPAQ